jgi:hypothetical protein
VFQRGLVHGCGALYAGVAICIAQLGDDDPRFAIKRAVRRQRGAAAVCELVTVRIGLVMVRDAVGEGVDQQFAEVVGGGGVVVAPALAGRRRSDLAAKRWIRHFFAGMMGTQGFGVRRIVASPYPHPNPNPEG